MKKIIAFAGSNSSQSINHQLVLAASKFVQNAEVEIISLRDYPADLFGVDLEAESGFPQTMKDLSAKFDEADGFLISSPEHNGSMPAVLKNTIDWISRIGEQKVFRNKPTVFLSTSPGARGGMSALKHILEIMPYRGADIVGGHSVGPFSEKVVNGELVEGEDREKIAVLLGKLVDSL